MDRARAPTCVMVAWTGAQAMSYHYLAVDALRRSRHTRSGNLEPTWWQCSDGLLMTTQDNFITPIVRDSCDVVHCNNNMVQDVGSYITFYIIIHISASTGVVWQWFGALWMAPAQRNTY